MNPILKLAQQIKDAEGVSLAAVIEKVEQIRASDIKTKEDVKKVAQALVQLKKVVNDIPLDNEVKKLQKAISDASERVSSASTKEIASVRTEIKATEARLSKEIADRIPDIITVTEKVTEVAKELDEQEQKKVLDKVLEEDFVAKVRDVIEGFEGDDRMDASKLKNLPQMQTLSAGGGSNLSVFKDGNQVSSSTRMNFTGSGVTVSNVGGMTNVAITGGSGASTFLALTDTPADYTSQGGKLVRVNTGEDALEFIDPPAGTGDVSGPASATNNNFAVFDGVTGKLIKDGGATVAGVRDRSTHTGTQAASTISDFDTEVSNNTDVAANTAARHAAVTVTDTPEINLTLTGQDIQAAIVAGSIDETKLDTSVNASLDLADSALQNIVEDTTPQLGGNLDAQGNDITNIDDLFLNSGGVINFGAGDVTVTNGTNTLTFAGATGGYIFDGQVGVTRAGNSFFAQNTSPTTSAQVTSFSGRNGGAADNDEAYNSLLLRNSASAQVEFARQTWKALDVTAGTEDGEYEHEVMVNGVMTTISKTNADGMQVTGALQASNLTASELTATDASKNIVSLPVATYPSLTELTRVKGVTSPIQTQLDAKAPTASPTFTGVLAYDAARGKVTAGGNLSTTETINFNSETNYTGTLDANITFTFANATSGDDVTLYLTYSGAQRTITWPTITWLDNATGAAPTTPAASGNVLVVTVRYIGTTYYASATGNYSVYA